MQTRTIIASLSFLGIGALAMTQLGFQSQSRQYKKTLAYMHDARDRTAEKFGVSEKK